MATPHVAGVAALIWSLDTEKTAQEIRAILEQSAEDLGSTGRDDSYGHGLIRADRAKELLDGFTLSPTTSTISYTTFVYIFFLMLLIAQRYSAVQYSTVR